MNSRLRYIFLSLWVGVYILYTTSACAQKLPFINYNTSNGLTHNRTHNIRQDSKGYMWIGTDMGIDRYDGRTFKHFPCPGNPYLSARGVSRDGDNVICSIDYYGIAVCNGDSVRFIPLKVKKNRSIGGVVCINDTTFYVVNVPNELYKISGRQTDRIMLPPAVAGASDFTDIFKDRKNNIWLIANDGLIYFPGHDMQHPIRVPFFERSYVYCMLQGRNDDIYISAHNGIFKYTERQCDSLPHATPEMILPQLGIITSFAFDADNDLWMSNCYKGIYKYDIQTKALAHYNMSNGLISQNAWSVYCDKENDLWVATENGISKLTTQYYSSADISNTDYQNVKNACSWNDSTLLFTNLISIYAYTNKGIAEVKGYSTGTIGMMRDILLKTPTGKLLVNINTTSDGSRFIKKTMVYDLQGNTLVQGKPLSSLPGGINMVYTEDGVAKINDEMWVNTSNGLQHYKNGIYYKVPKLAIGNDSVIITYITCDIAGNLWILNNRKELLQYTISSGTKSTFPYALTLKQRIESAQLGNDQYSKIFIDSTGRIFLCSYRLGLHILYTDKGKVTRIDNLPPAMFSNGIINDVTEDDQHNIWVATATGLDKMTWSKDTFNVEKDMYGSELCGRYIFFVKKHGDKLFVGTTGCMGIISLHYEETNTPPDIYISGIKIDDMDKSRLLGTVPELKPDENIINFIFTGISFKDERRIRYSYMLEGLDDDWSAPKTEYRITYSRVPPGTYTFKVRALSAAGVWSVHPATFTFTIAKPYYLQWWFIALVTMIVCAVIYSIYRYRINRLMEIQNIRYTISKDLHDDIGATVSSINILANMAKSDLVSESKRNQFLETIQEESKHVSESLSDIVWSINPKYDSLEIMFARMQRYASELFEARNVAYEFTMPGLPLEELTMDMTRRQQVYLIFKEAVNNLVKYSAAANAEVILSISKSRFTMTITDDGKGFDTQTVHPGNGIFNMKKRAQDINADLSIDSAVNKGTRIILNMSF